MDEPAGLKREFNVSGFDVTVEVDDEVLTQGDTISGTVTVGCSGSEPFNALTLRLQEFWPKTEAPEGGSLTTRTARRTASELTLTTFSKTRVVRRFATSFQVDDARAYPFEVELPRNARISTERAGWRLAVGIDCLQPAYPQVERVRLTVGPAEEVDAIREVFVDRLKFVEEVERRRWSPERVTTTFWLKPPKVLEPALDAVILELQQDDQGGVIGTITFDRAEQGIADYFKALLGQDKVTREVGLDAAELYDEEDGFRMDDLTRAFGNLLNRVIAEG